MTTRLLPQPASYFGCAGCGDAVARFVHDEGSDVDDEPGITIEDLPDIYREGFLYVIEMARARHDPSKEWRAFSEYIGQGLIRVFGLDAPLD